MRLKLTQNYSFDPHMDASSERDQTGGFNALLKASVEQINDTWKHLVMLQIFSLQIFSILLINEGVMCVIFTIFTKYSVSGG